MAAVPTYNISVPTVISGTATTLDSVIAQGAASVTLNDCATVGAAAPSNQILQRQLQPGEALPLSWPCATGLVVSKILGTIAIAAG